jgi:phosphoribosylformimino-5-aminoimidazole carboxamide ribotide isomerase
MTRFRPCIDLHDGQVKQIVGGSLTDQGADTNFVSDRDAAWYANLYRGHELTGGHVIALGPGNSVATNMALAAWPGGLQFGGGVNLENAASWLEAGASHVIVTSWLFEDDQLSWQRLEQLKVEVGADRLVLDLSCRRVADGWCIATNRWQTVTATYVNSDTLSSLSAHCAEFLVHAADVEGLQSGVDEELVSLLAECCDIPVTYAGGARSLQDLERVAQLSGGGVDLTIGSALDIFGGQGVTLDQCIAWNTGNPDRLDQY